MTTALQEKPSASLASKVDCRACTDCDVLVIEDDDDCRDALSSLLCSEGYRVETAASGAEALDALASMSKPPRFVLLDLVMPGMSGFEFLRAMRRVPAFVAIPVVVHSGLLDDPELGVPPVVERWLRKPATVDDLLDVARQLAG